MANFQKSFYAVMKIKNLTFVKEENTEIANMLITSFAGITIIMMVLSAVIVMLILSILMANKGQIVSKDTLIAKVWGIESSAVDNNVEAYVSFIRKKFKHLGSSAQIETVRKVGYRLIEG